jgi:adenosine deaminase
MRIALGSDDPAIFGTTGLTDDLWMTYVAWRLDLRTLKRLAVTSILRSSLPADRLQRQLDRFQARWQRFIRGVVEEEAAAGGERPGNLRGRASALRAA